MTDINMTDINIFKNAYFGKPYKTRDERRAIYFINNQCIVDGELVIHSYCSNGDYSVHGAECGLDIISEWDEEIDEKKLDELTSKIYPDEEDDGEPIQGIYMSNLKEVYKAGYRKAKEGKQ